MCEGCNSGNLTTSQRAMKWRLLHFFSHFAVTFFTLIKAQYPEKLMEKSQCIAANPRVRLLYRIFSAIEVIAFYCSTFLQIYSKNNRGSATAVIVFYQDTYSWSIFL